jgi:hypothetical protein
MGLVTLKGGQGNNVEHVFLKMVKSIQGFKLVPTLIKLSSITFIDDIFETNPLSHLKTSLFKDFLIFFKGINE